MKDISMLDLIHEGQAKGALVTLRSIAKAFKMPIKEVEGILLMNGIKLTKLLISETSGNVKRCVIGDYLVSDESYVMGRK